MAEDAKLIRCAIYTRKSSDEGLAQAFNSLHAQRESCVSYIRSQRGEGWEALPERYDDGGYSGGNMNRPALGRLLADVAAGRIDAVVVYKVDRLTRSLADFGRIIETLESGGVAFVSVTQAFNTTTSTGRLALNVLLSFAQFEREIAGERIRDKISASKAKGMWMGGNIPLGYDPPAGSDRALVVSEHEAVIVRTIFRLFVMHGNLLTLQKQLDGEGVRSKSWISTRGRPMGGCRFSRGALRYLLANRVYLGEITHKGISYPGRHAAIVDAPTFDAAQGWLTARSQRRRTHVGRARRMLLYGLLFDVDGTPMDPVFSGRRKQRRYEYYASRPISAIGMGDAPDDAVRRVPAHVIDELVKAWTARLLGLEDLTPTADQVRGLIGRAEIHPAGVHLVVRSRALPGQPRNRDALERIRRSARPDEHVLPDPAHPGLIRLSLPVRVAVRSGRKWLTTPGGTRGHAPEQPDAVLVRRLRAGHDVLRRCCIEPYSIKPPPYGAKAPKSARERKLAQLAFLAPDIQQGILDGSITSYPSDTVPISWAAQRTLLRKPLQVDCRRKQSSEHS